ncbi:hypothetical protein GGTG_10929 [Gaeumannomyces tritici R3-111a-1]|uniref:C2H2-type domain-containing protein n=1 Tax=Gaeumannomyces tritici (strain R3-111a-1) TaxID=644352 RepID=J3PBQ8_GAET3|nr:hypothetical protein GGTG_10929 [Gaeumannomyces tritici R3-111a-1]EJT71675.1 hypothetical protein GGTG_10929 [Gaeumannomyces tritici R3-111a-1]
MSDTIADHVGRALAAFRVLVEPNDKLNFGQSWILPRIKDAQSKFIAWANDIGAQKTDTSSLDHRLRNASRMKNLEVKLLAKLVDFLEEARAIATGEATPWDQLEDEVLDPDSGLPITELGQIAIDGVEHMVDSLVELNRTLESLAPGFLPDATYPADASHSEPSDTQHIQSEFPTIEPPAEPAVFEDGGSETGASQTSHAASVACSDALQIPSMPEEAQADPFRCTLCLVKITATDRTSRRHEWLQHLERTHWHVYPCPLGCTSIFRSASLCSSHLTWHHACSLAQGEIDLMVRLASRPLDIATEIPCPFCGDREVQRSKEEHQRHIRRHHEQLSALCLD